MSEIFTEKVLALKPLYEELVASVIHFKKLVPFCMQWGSKYPVKPNTGIMFYGRATNDWVTHDLNIERLFDLNNRYRIFARDDQMQWVYDSAGYTEGYNTNKSAFWRIIRSVAETIYEGPKALNKVCWSNLCKMALPEGNPTNDLYKAELESCQKIMSKEIEIFSPRHVVLLTGSSWAKDFLYHLNGNMHTSSIYKCPWGTSNQYMVKVYHIKGIYYYVSEHPQGKDEYTHSSAILQAIREFDRQQ